MRTLGVEGECPGDLRRVGGAVPTIHNTLYRYNYHLSIDIDKVLGPGLIRGGGKKEKSKSPPSHDEGWGTRILLRICRRGPSLW